MKLEELKEKIGEELKALSAYELVYMWNDYCDDVRYYDDRIYMMDELDDLFCGCSPTEVLDKCRDVDTSDDFWKDTIYGVKSISDVEDEIDIDDLIDWIIEKGHSDNADINELLEEYETEYGDNE